jgi:hypothetical protein
MENSNYVRRSNCTCTSQRCHVRFWEYFVNLSKKIPLNVLGGDASTRYLAFHQDEVTALLKDSKPFPDQPPDQPWRGRDNYHCFGVLRTKPGRADSPPTVSMSCSDKIASWNILGIQGALCAQMFLPVYISSIIIGEVEEKTRDVVKGDCLRALWERIPDLKGQSLSFVGIYLGTHASCRAAPWIPRQPPRSRVLFYAIRSFA